MQIYVESHLENACCLLFVTNPMGYGTEKEKKKNKAKSQKKKKIRK